MRIDFKTVGMIYVIQLDLCQERPVRGVRGLRRVKMLHRNQIVTKPCLFREAKIMARDLARSEGAPAGHMLQVRLGCVEIANGPYDRFTATGINRVHIHAGE